MAKIKILFYRTIAFFIPIFIRKKNYKCVVFVVKGDRFASNSKILFQYMIEHTDYEIKYIISNTALREKLNQEFGDYFISPDNIKNIIYIAQAGVWITDGGFYIKTPFGHYNRVLINLWH